MTDSVAAAPLDSMRSSKPRKTSLLGFIFAAVAYLYAIPLFLCMMTAHPFVRILDNARRRFHNGVASLWMKLSMATCLLLPRIQGRENLPSKGRNCIFVPNHSSFLDIFMLGWLGRPLKYVSKAEIFKIPIIGWAMSMNNFIALQRGSRKAQLQCYKDMVTSLKDGNNLVLFPEGTRSRDGHLQKFRSGAFRAAIETGSLIVPITIVGARDVYPPGSLVPIRFPTSRLELVIHPSIDPSGKTDKEISDIAYEAIHSALPAELQQASEEPHSV